MCLAAAGVLNRKCLLSGLLYLFLVRAACSCLNEMNNPESEFDYKVRHSLNKEVQLFTV